MAKAVIGLLVALCLASIVAGASVAGIEVWKIALAVVGFFLIRSASKASRR